MLQFDHYRQQCQAETRHWQYEVNEVVLIERVHKDSAPTVGLLPQVVEVNFDILHRVNRVPNPQQHVARRQKQADHVLENAAKLAKKRVFLRVLHITAWEARQ